MNNEQYKKELSKANKNISDLKQRGDLAIGENWDDLRNEIFTQVEIEESNLRVSLIAELVKARQEKGMTQKKLEELSGVRQPIIARMEKGYTSPQLETLLKVLTPLGKTLAIVPLEEHKHH